LERPTSGQVLIRGEEMSHRPPHRRPTNLVFQRLALFPHLTVADNVAFGPRLHRWPKQRVERTVAEMLDLVELADLGNRLPAQLSGGQQQRVAIARALANEPAVLLLDEPLGSLDLKLRVQMQRALKQIQHQSGTTFVYVTHDQVEALTMSDRMAVMHDGRIEQVGVPADLYRMPATRFVATFLGETNLFDGAVRDGKLDTGDIEVRVPAAGVAASVRPERVVLAKRLSTDLANRFTGRLEDVTFQGSTVRCQVRLPSGRTLVAERPAEAGDGFVTGEDVEVGWSLEATVMLSK
jgi:ABC-type Fe3+/spermidine/putrescine transport system ATPase subunit